MSTPKKNQNPAIEALAAPISALIAKGKKEGILQSSELNNELAKIPCTVEQIEQVYELLESMGIQIAGTELDLEAQAQAVIEVFGNPEKKSRIVYRPDKPNNTPSFLFDMTKAKTDFGFVPQYTNYTDMMRDYKEELESGRWDAMIRERAK